MPILSKKFRETVPGVTLPRKYAVLSVLYGLSTLIVPLATQYLVNNLSLSSILANTFIFLLILLGFLGVSQVLRFGQIVVLEYIQREIYVQETRKWFKQTKQEKSHYLLEVQNVMKTFSQAGSHIIEFGLTLFFGVLLIVTFHPLFIFLPVIIAAAIWRIFSSWVPGVQTSIKESSEKYKLVEKKFAGEPVSEDDLVSFLACRDSHFTYVKQATVVTGVTFVLSQLFLLGSGIYLIGKGELSVGQLVSAEIILTGIMVAFAKFPKTLEAMYDLETSQIKLEKALGAKDAH